VKFLVYDAPLNFGESYEDRLIHFRKHISTDNPILKVIDPVKIVNKDHSQYWLQNSSGLLFRKPLSKFFQNDSFYKFDRTTKVFASVLSNKPSWKCTDPHGKIYYLINAVNINLEPQTIVTLEILGAQPDGSFLASLKTIRNDLTWHSLLESNFPYYVDTSLRSAALCRSCGNQFKKSELRVKTTLLRPMPNSIRPFLINLCMKEECIKLSKYGKRYSEWQVEPFKGKIRVPLEVTQDLPKLHDVQWIFERDKAKIE